MLDTCGFWYDNWKLPSNNANPLSFFFFDICFKLKHTRQRLHAIKMFTNRTNLLMIRRANLVLTLEGLGITFEFFYSRCRW